jgi:arabinofuranosyltransferase
LWRGTLFRFESEHDWVDLGRELRAQAEEEGPLTLPQGANGFTGYYAGPQVYLVHGLALTDGLLARVPPIYNPNWRSGHFMRRIPGGYVEVEAGTQTNFDDPELDAYYQQIRLATHGPLFTAERWAAIWNLNTHDFADLLPGYSDYFRFPDLQVARLENLPSSTTIVNIEFSGQGSAAQVEFHQLVHAPRLALRASADNFNLVFLDAADQPLGSLRLYSVAASGLEDFAVDVPAAIAEQGYAALRLVPIRVLYDEADGEYSFYSLRTINE